MTAVELRRFAAEAVVFGYPLVLLDTVRRVHPLSTNQILHLPDDSSAIAPGLGDDDVRTVKSSAWIDLSEGPVVLSVPNVHGRHLAISVFDAWGGTVAALGSRTQADEGHDIALVSPHWHGELEAGLIARRARTNAVWAVSRITAHTPADRVVARDLLARQHIMPLSPKARPTAITRGALEPPARPSVDIITDMGPEVFFHRLAMLLERHPPRREEAPMAESLARFGVTPGEAYRPPEADALRQAVSHGFADGLAKIRRAAEAHLQGGGAWRSAYGPPASSDPLTRSGVAMANLGAPGPDDVLHLVCDIDSEGRPLRGSERYELRFASDETPPVNAFWSLAFARRPSPGELSLRRYALSDRDGLAFDPGGALTLVIQHAAPPLALASNWLPAPPNEFVLTLRLHWPKRAAINGAWKPPEVIRLDPNADGRRPRMSTRTRRRAAQGDSKSDSAIRRM